MKTKTSILAKIFLMFLVTLIIVSCESKDNVQSDIDKLRTERQKLQNENYSLNSEITNNILIIAKQKEELSQLNILKSGRTPKYIIKVHLKQSHLSLSISKHIKDAMNAIDFEIPVDKEYYDNIQIGTRIVDNFRVGSCILYGSFGNWEMTVISKRIQ